MTLSPEKIAAYAQMDEAIHALVEAHNGDLSLDDNGFVTSWVLISNEIRQNDHASENGRMDELDMIHTIGCFSKRGQDPSLTLGIIHEYLRWYARK